MYAKRLEKLVQYFKTNFVVHENKNKKNLLFYVVLLLIFFELKVKILLVNNVRAVRYETNKKKKLLKSLEVL